MTIAEDLRGAAVGVEALEATNAALESANAGLRVASAQQQATIAQLQADLLECQTPDPPPPPPTTKTVFGAYAQPQGKPAWDTFVANIGPAKVTRIFYGSQSNVEAAGVPFPGVATIASFHSRSFTEPGVVLTHTQVAAGVLDARTTTFANKVKAWLAKNPNDLFIMCFIAEPDVAANIPYGGPKDYVKAYLQVRKVFDAVVKVPWAMILTGYTFALNNVDRNPGMYWDDSMEYVGIDPYNMGWRDANWKASLRGEVTVAANMAAAKGNKGLIVPEFGCCPHESDPNRRAGWLTEQDKVFRELGVDFATYFNADKSATEEAHRDFRLLGAAEVAAYHDILVRP